MKPFISIPYKRNHDFKKKNPYMFSMCDADILSRRSCKMYSKEVQMIIIVDKRLNYSRKKLLPDHSKECSSKFYRAISL